MPNVEVIVREIQRDLVPEFEKKLRAYLVEQDKDWLIEQIVRLTLDAHSLEEMDRRHVLEEKKRRKGERAGRLKRLGLDTGKLHNFIDLYKDHTRDRLIQEKFLSGDAPPKGKALIGDEFRSPEGNDLLQQAKDMLFGLLFGDESTNTRFRRNRRNLLTLTIPRIKSDVLDFMEAATELSARGTWQATNDPASETRTDNVILEIEYGDNEEEGIGHGLITALKLINNLEINEEVLYGRMEKIEQSTLVS